jgi:DNA-binding MarR family transcriptional regulator
MASGDDARQTQRPDPARLELVERIMSAHDRLFNSLQHDRTQMWLDVDLTIQQLKTLLLTVREGAMIAGQISRELRVGFSTVTGLVDRLAEQGLVDRGEDPRDRRATRVTPTVRGRDLVARLYSYRRERLRRLLERAGTEALVHYEDGLTSLAAAAEQLLEEGEDLVSPTTEHLGSAPEPPPRPNG